MTARSDLPHVSMLIRARALAIGWLPHPSLEIRRYSRFVDRARFVLPMLACLLLVLIAVWPQFSAGFAGLGREEAKLAAAEIHDLKMVKPRYTGLDRNDRPFSVAAATALQTGPDSGKADGLLALEAPAANLIARDGAAIVVTGDSGIYQPQNHALDLFGHVILNHDRGYRFETSSARVDLAGGTTEGHEPVTGSGPAGSVEAEGFRITEQGDIVQFTGKAHLVAQGTAGRTP